MTTYPRSLFVGRYLQHLLPLIELRCVVRQEPDTGAPVRSGDEETVAACPLPRPLSQLLHAAARQQDSTTRPEVLPGQYYHHQSYSYSATILQWWTYIFHLVRVETVVSPQYEPPGDPVMLLTADTPLLLLKIALGQNLLRHVELGPDADSLNHIVRLGDAQLERLIAPLGHANHLGVRQVQHVHPVDGEEDVADSEAGALGRGTGLDGRHHHGPGAVDTETELSLHSLHSHRLVAFCDIFILISKYRELESDIRERFTCVQIKTYNKGTQCVSFEMFYGEPEPMLLKIVHQL